MRREQMVENAARAMHQHGLDVGAEHADWDNLPGSVRGQYLDSARAAVDAVFPEPRPQPIAVAGWQPGAA